MTEIAIRDESPEDAAAIAAVTDAAFEGHPHSNQTEARVIAGLRAGGALSLSLVATQDDSVVGHIAFSAVTIDGVDRGWFGLGPVSVLPAEQGNGIGAALIREGLARIAARGGNGCVLLGDPAYYARFGFESDAALTWGGAPNPYFQRLVLRGAAPTGDVAYHPAFDVE